MNIKETAQAIHANNKAKGFWDFERNVGEMLMLVTSELSEALEADRKGKRANLKGFDLMLWSDLEESNDSFEYLANFKNAFTHCIKDSFEDEIADAVIRLLDIAEGMDIDLEFHIKQKMRFNSTREKMHGKKY